MPMPADPDYPSGVPVREVDGRACTNRVGIAVLAGWAPGHSVHTRALCDPIFPEPAGKVGREFWYPLDGEDGVHAYLATHRALVADATAKPPPVPPGDPDELLDPEGAAEAIGVTLPTFNGYVWRSGLYWEGYRSGYPLLPAPDRVTPATTSTGRRYEKREWRRSTLAKHQAGRPGRTAGGGRPKHT